MAHKNFVNKTKGFTVVENSFLNDHELGFAEKGLYVFLKSKPDGWSFSSDRICLQTKECRKTIQRLLNEIERLGLLRRSRKSDGRMVYEILDFEEKAKVPKVTFGSETNVPRDKCSLRQSLPDKKDSVKEIKMPSKKEGIEGAPLGPLSGCLSGMTWDELENAI